MNEPWPATVAVQENQVEALMQKSPINGYTHSTITSGGKKTLNNQDACLLLLTARGGVAKSRDLISDLQAWRPGLHFVYLFNTCHCGGYGFVGENKESKTNSVGWRKSDGKWTSSPRRTFWTRTSTGVYELTLEGIKRLSELYSMGITLTLTA